MSGKPARISPRSHEPFVGVRRGHPDVDDRDRRLVHGDVTEQVVGVVGLGDDVEARFAEQPHDSLPEEDRVLRDHDRHRVAEHRDRVPERREVARQPVREQLVDVLGLRQARQPVAAEIAHREPLRRAGSRREEDLAAVARGADPGGAMDVDAGVALVGDQGLADVDSHPHADGVVARPLRLDQPALGLDRRGHGFLERREGGEELVTVARRSPCRRGS